MPEAGDVVTVDFVGATGTKRRPAVVVSSSLYPQHRPDLVLGVLTSQVSRATTPVDLCACGLGQCGLASTLSVSRLLWDGDSGGSAGDWAFIGTRLGGCSGLFDACVWLSSFDPTLGNPLCL
jgi:mRNA-degrading endonuclease toxin of MazEF toxin-antitoxin module